MQPEQYFISLRELESRQKGLATAKAGVTLMPGNSGLITLENR
jgi:hypothetical protein